MRALHVDIETSSELDLPKVGVDAYARHASTRILMVCWAIDGTVTQWDYTQPTPPRDLIALLLDPSIIKHAHNAFFEFNLFTHVWDLHLSIDTWVCTMAWAYMLGLPGALADLGDVLKVPAQFKKSKSGDRLMRLFSKPQKVSKKYPNRWRTPDTNPVEWAGFLRYNHQDVVAEMFIAEHRLNRFPLPDNEWAMWRLDFEINQRGLPIDTTLVRNAVKMVDDELAKLRQQLAAITGLANPNSDAQFGPWIRERGYPFGDLKKATVERVLADVELAHLRQPLALRAQLKMMAVAKFYAVNLQVAPDGWLRFTYQFSGASRTGRWAGRGAHFQNVKKSSKELEPYYNDIIDSVRRNEVGWIRSMYGSPMRAISGVVRGMIRAPQSHKLIVADYSSIEAWVVAWLSRCQTMLDVAAAGLDIYKTFAVELYGVAYEDVTKAMRTDAKPPVLGCGFRLSGGEERRNKNGDTVKTGLWGYAWNLGIQLDRETCHRAVAIYREKYTEVPQLWYDIEAAAFHVVSRGGYRDVGYLGFDMSGPFMRMHLPSGRILHYLRPKLEKRMMPWGKEKWSLTFEGQEEVEEGRRMWGRQATHGGKLCENATQATANCIMRQGLINASEDGFHPVGHSHDEAITCEPVDSDLDHVALCASLTRKAKWMEGIPLSAAGFESVVYRKD